MTEPAAKPERCRLCGRKFSNGLDRRHDTQDPTRCRGCALLTRATNRRGMVMA